jgi:serine/threonine protein kinase
VYSLGVVLYEVLAGRRPFLDEDPGVLVRRILRDAPEPPRALRPEIEPAVKAVALKALAKKPEERFHRLEADLFVARGDLCGAIGAFGRALEIDPDDDGSLYRRAALLLAHGEIGAAIADVRAYGKKYPGGKYASCIAGVIGGE